MDQNFKQTAGQTQETSQVQLTSTLQIALSNMVGLPVANFAEYIKDELMNNEALEVVDGRRDDDYDNAAHDGGDNDKGDGDDAQAAKEKDDAADDMGPEWDYDGTEGEIHDSLGDYSNEDEVPTYLQARADSARENFELSLTGGTSAYDDLIGQVGEHELNDQERQVLEYIIGSLEDDGYLRKDLSTIADELAIYHGVYTDEQEVARMLDVLQTFEPAGIGARSLQECLLLQLRRPGNVNAAYREQAIFVVEKCFDLFKDRKWDDIAGKLKLADPKELEPILKVLTRLNPRPGALLGSGTASAAPTVMPDFYVRENSDGQLVVELNNDEIPELCVSRSFRESLKRGKAGKKLSKKQEEEYIYARSKVESAQTFINLIARRQQTLLAVMRVIVALQRDFFVNDDDESMLHPMILKDVADRAKVDVSTVSRVVNSKYVETNFGFYSLKSFFSSQFTTESGEEMSARKIREAIREIVDAEDKRRPLSDEAITAALKARDLIVARRTVAKYREQLGILKASLRRQ